MNRLVHLFNAPLETQRAVCFKYTDRTFPETVMFDGVIVTRHFRLVWSEASGLTRHYLDNPKAAAIAAWIARQETTYSTPDFTQVWLKAKEELRAEADNTARSEFLFSGQETN